MYVCTHKEVWRSQDNWEELCVSLYSVDPEIELRPWGLAATIFTSRAIEMIQASVFRDKVRPLAFVTN